MQVNPSDTLMVCGAGLFLISASSMEHAVAPSGFSSRKSVNCLKLKFTSVLSSHGMRRCSIITPISAMNTRTSLKLDLPSIPFHNLSSHWYSQS